MERLASKLIFALFLVTLILVSSVGGATELERVVITLPESVNVQGNIMLLGEIAELSGPELLQEKVAAVNAGTAPRPGSSRRLTKGQIEVRLRQAGLDLNKIEFQGPSTVQVYGVNEAVIQEGAIGNVDGTPVYEVVVAARDLRRGDIITESDLTIEEKKVRNAQPDGRGIEDFLGLRVKRTILAGAPLTNLNVEQIPTIERGEQVTIMVRTSALVITAPGVAKGSGGVGQIIPVENTLSREIIQAQIIDENTVQVNMRGSGTP